jgi:glycosyltransferase involved in cell wall biosynthesis
MTRNKHDINRISQAGDPDKLSKRTGVLMRNETSQPLISACMIVKNEEAFLPRCLASIRKLADEIVLVDTGSSDQTLEIAREFGCKIYHFPWNGDFSAARNESLRYASGEWILVIDADEEVPADTSRKIRSYLDNPQYEIISISVYNKSLETGRVSSFLPSVRFFRRRLGLSYQGIVHNRLALPSNVPVTRCDIRLYHYGYDQSREKLEDKKARSRQLLERQLQENPDDVFANFNMAQLLRGLDGTADEATCRRIIEHAQRVVNSPQRDSTGYAGYRLMALVHTAIALCTLKRYDEAEQYCAEALIAKPDYVDAMLVLGNVNLAAGKLHQARDAYTRYLSAAAVYIPEKETTDVIIHYLDADYIARYGLGVIAQLEGDFDAALEHFRYVHEKMGPYLDIPRRIEAVTARKKLRTADALIRSGKPLEAATEVKQAIELSDHDPGIWFDAGNVFFALNDAEAALSCYQRVFVLCPDHPAAMTNLGNCYFRMAAYEKASAVYTQVIQRHPDQLEAMRNLGVARARLSDYPQALAVLMGYIQKRPEDIEILRLTGDLFSAVDCRHEAIGCYEKYLTRHPQDTDCLLNLAEEYYRLGYLDSASIGFERVLAADPACEAAKLRLASIGRPGTG